MRLDEFMLLTLLHIDEKMIAGRTLLQKTLYFLNETLQLGFEFTPHYYGPYSSKITETVEGLKSSGIVAEKIDKFPVFNFSVEYEPKKYTYKLTKIGKEIAEHIEKERPEEAIRIKNELSLMKQFGVARDYKNLSIAAKMYHILKRENKLMTTYEIMEEGKVLDWDIGEKEAQKALTFLKGMKLAS
ncbi:MAG: hypothetical protein J5U17_04765 [Candidatus Methanoperedens sp.]|nr:hypothetical protein [Candidatus Methanoperedens sp.]MCE8426821.1 hypothetical protein [Candidatus Methanoperedens sp.]